MVEACRAKDSGPVLGESTLAHFYALRPSLGQPGTAEAARLGAGHRHAPAVNLPSWVGVDAASIHQTERSDGLGRQALFLGQDRPASFNTPLQPQPAVFLEYVGISPLPLPPGFFGWVNSSHLRPGPRNVPGCMVYR